MTKFKNLFSEVQMSNPKSSRFDLSHEVKTSFDMGQLVPTTCFDVLPGDSITLNSEILARFAPLVSPVMHKVELTTHFFFVPNRLLWDEWEDWISGDVDSAHPVFTVPAEIGDGTLGCHLGYNNEASFGIEANPFAIAAYHLIYDEYYRDQNLQTEVFQKLTAGDTNSYYETPANSEPLIRAWQHDYFTACLPFAQKGDDVLIPLGQFADVPILYNTSQGNEQIYRNHSTGAWIQNDPASNWATDTQGRLTNPSTRINLDVSETHVAQTSALEQQANSITTLRRSFKLQEWLERNARGGTRYVESLYSHWGVKSKDARLNRPEYIGGQKAGMTISEVLSTATTEITGGEVPTGNMAGHGISVSGGSPNKYYATEHGWILGITSAMPVSTYQEGIPRMHTRTDRLDYAWPTFQHIGEQPVLLKELFTNTSTVEELDEVFGYIPRYSEYRYLPSRVSGNMKNELAFWHLGRTFGSNKPQLNSDFIECVPDKRIFAATGPSDDTIYAHVYNNISAVRKLSKYGTPKM